MSVLVDTGVLYAHHDRDAERHEEAVAVVDELLDGRFGRPYVSDYIYDETVTLTRMRTGSFDAARTISDRVLGNDPFPKVFELLYVGRDDFQETIELWDRYDDHELSFTDATLIALCNRRDIDGVVSFDSDFDGLVRRYDPLDYA